jgi:AcrR family transcriptional regulator
MPSIISTNHHPKGSLAAEPHSTPPAKKRLVQAMARLLADKDFGSITTAEISSTAKANEALIYRYFTDKRGLLHHLLHDYLLDFLDQMQGELKDTQSAVDKLRLLIQGQIRIYDQNRVFAKILLLEVRNFPGYFESSTYKIVKIYSKLITDIIEKGQRQGQIRCDIPAKQIRNLILGAIEHFCMAPLIFGREISVQGGALELSDLIFEGILKKTP